MFNGVARLVLLRTNYGDLGHERSQDYYDMQWRLLPVRNLDVPCSTNPVPRPREFDTMRVMAAAIEYGRRIIDDLRKDHRPEAPEATIVVKTTAGEVIYRFPGN
jgi:hypothetical protein